MSHDRRNTCPFQAWLSLYNDMGKLNEETRIFPPLGASSLVPFIPPFLVWSMGLLKLSLPDIYAKTPSIPRLLSTREMQAASMMQTVLSDWQSFYVWLNRRKLLVVPDDMSHVRERGECVSWKTQLQIRGHSHFQIEVRLTVKEPSSEVQFFVYFGAYAIPCSSAIVQHFLLPNVARECSINDEYVSLSRMVFEFCMMQKILVRQIRHTLLGSVTNIKDSTYEPVMSDSAHYVYWPTLYSLETVYDLVRQLKQYELKKRQGKVEVLDFLRMLSVLCDVMSMLQHLNSNDKMPIDRVLLCEIASYCYENFRFTQIEHVLDDEFNRLYQAYQVEQSHVSLALTRHVALYPQKVIAPLVAVSQEIQSIHDKALRLNIPNLIAPLIKKVDRVLSSAKRKAPKVKAPHMSVPKRTRAKTLYDAPETSGTFFPSNRELSKMMGTPHLFFSPRTHRPKPTPHNIKYIFPKQKLTAFEQHKVSYIKDALKRECERLSQSKGLCFIRKPGMLKKHELDILIKGANDSDFLQLFDFRDRKVLFDKPQGKAEQLYNKLAEHRDVKWIRHSGLASSWTNLVPDLKRLSFDGFIEALSSKADLEPLKYTCAPTYCDTK